MNVCRQLRCAMNHGTSKELEQIYYPFECKYVHGVVNACARPHYRDYSLGQEEVLMTLWWVWEWLTGPASPSLNTTTCRVFLSTHDVCNELLSKWDGPRVENSIQTPLEGHLWPIQGYCMQGQQLFLQTWGQVISLMDWKTSCMSAERLKWACTMTQGNSENV